MKKIILERKKEDIINLYEISEYTPIFAKMNNKLVGMVVQENDHNYQWTLKLGGCINCSGIFDTREECMLSANRYGYTFYIED